MSVAVAQPPREDPTPTQVQPVQEQSTAASAAPDGRVYLAAAHASLSRWLRILGPAPWLADESRSASASYRSASVLYRQQAATLAIAMLCELDPQRPDRPYLREVVRTSLIRWQLSLSGDGRPAHYRLRRSPLHAAILWHVVLLLSETTGFQTGLLLSDIERHLRWLVRRPQRVPWLEAATLCAMADGAVLVRDAALLAQARDRLSAFLARQDEEGWFPERGGADIGRLSLTVDALARLYRQSGWGELEEPLRRALGFLIHFVHPDGSAGGCYSSCDTAFLTPYGVELLAPTFTDAAALALLGRRQCERFETHRAHRWPDGLCAVWGANLTLAAANATSRFPASCTYPCDAIGHKRFPHAALSIFSTGAYHAVVGGKKGGALRVTWRTGAAGLDDPGVTVVYPHKTRTSARSDRRIVEHVTDSSVTASGFLRRTKLVSDRLRRWIKRPLWWIGSRRRAFSTPLLTKESHPPRIDYQRLTHDRYNRQITFGEDWIRIRDCVHCRLPCKTIICQSPSPVRGKPFSDSSILDPRAHTPIFVDGGRNVEITRLYRNGELVDHHPDSPQGTQRNKG
ncbi:MAG: hypothetical protein WBE26_08270 [Phycisphaerae bacterium]